jgi:hypothetical protein
MNADDMEDMRSGVGCLIIMAMMTLFALFAFSTTWLVYHTFEILKKF